jgi:hypothetical protein
MVARDDVVPARARSRGAVRQVVAHFLVAMSVATGGLLATSEPASLMWLWVIEQVIGHVDSGPVPTTP